MSGKDLQAVFGITVMHFDIQNANVHFANRPACLARPATVRQPPSLHQNQCSPNWATTENALSYNLSAIHRALLCR